MKTIEEYLALGFDLKTAEYFSAGRKKILSVVPNRDFSLILGFNNGEKRRLDMVPILKKGTVFEPFMEYSNFSRVYLDDSACVSWDIDPEIDSNTVWSNKVDLCPDSCYMDSVPCT